MLKTHVSSVYKARRNKLIAQAPNSVFVFFANPEVTRNGSVLYTYRQETNLYYLTGFEEPESIAVLTAEGQFVLFVRKRDPEKEMWEGEHYGIEGATQVFGADRAFLIEDFQNQFPALCKNAERIFYRTGRSEKEDRLMNQLLDAVKKKDGRSGKGLLPIVDPSEIVGELRVIKDAEEINQMRKAAEISAHGHVQAMIQARPGMNEFEIEALLDYEFRKKGCKRNGYDAIVAGGKNAACLHYRANNEPLRDGELLLIDAGGEFEYYTADITRTFPVGKKFTDAQARVYDIVLDAQLAGIAMAKPGATQQAIHKKATEVLVDGLIKLGLLSGNRDELINSGAHRRFYPHSTGHFLGSDVHDAGLYMLRGEPRKLEAGMTFTIEPGFYVQPGDTAVPPEYRNIGIRIEDDILITPTGCEVLTKAVPKTRAEIEALKK